MSPDGSTVLFGALPKKLMPSAEGKRRLSRFARRLSARVAQGRAFVCLITNDRELHRLNRDFLGNDYPTDVLSFPAADASLGLGELAISIEQAHRQAEQFGHACLAELQILMLHGLLHLTGLDHEADAGAMAEAERHWRAELDLPLTLIARSQPAAAGITAL